MRWVKESYSDDVGEILKIKSLLHFIYFILEAVLDEDLVLFKGGVSWVGHVEESLVACEPNVVDDSFFVIWQVIKGELTGHINRHRCTYIARQRYDLAFLVVSHFICRKLQPSV